jgi:hypothetical protein
LEEAFEAFLAVLDTYSLEQLVRHQESELRGLLSRVPRPETDHG